MNEFERGFMVGLILGEGSFSSIVTKRFVPGLEIYNIDLSILEFAKQILMEMVGDLGYNPITIRVKKGEDNLRRKRPVHRISVGGRRLKKLIELLPELKNFDKTSAWVIKIEQWKPIKKGRWLSLLKGKEAEKLG